MAASMQLVILSSSPLGRNEPVTAPPQSAQSRLSEENSSSSESLPSLSTFLKNMKPNNGTKSGSRAAQIAVASPTSAQSMERLVQEVQHDVQPLEDSVTIKRLKRLRKREPEFKTAQQTPAREQRTLSHVADPQTDIFEFPPPSHHPAEPLPSKSTKNPRAKKEKAESQTKLKSGKVTKPRTSGSSKRTVSKTTKASATVSEHFVIEGANTTATISPRRADVPLNLELEQADKRRSDWTPPKDTRQTPIKTTSTGSPSISTSSHGNAVVLTDILAAYSYQAAVQSEQDSAIPVRNVSGEPFTKRKKIEFMPPVVGPAPAMPEDPHAAKPAAQKQPKKKPRTITESATEQYKRTNTSAIGSTTSDFFAPQSLDSSESKEKRLESQVQSSKAEFKKPGRPRKSKDPAKAASGRSKKSASVARKLLSPETAALRIQNQDLLFGTSSQLAREDSPTFLRDLQQAMRDSEAASDNIASETPSGHMQSSFSRLKSSKTLWSAAARDEKDSLLEPQPGLSALQQPSLRREFQVGEDVALIETAKSKNANTSTILHDRRSDMYDDSFIDIDSIPARPSVLQKTTLGKSDSVLPEFRSVLDDDSFVDIDTTSVRPTVVQNAVSAKAGGVLQERHLDVDTDSFIDIDTIPIRATKVQSTTPAKAGPKTALQPLMYDANPRVLSPHPRRFSTTSNDAASKPKKKAKDPVGKPPVSDQTQQAEAPPKKRRGRPPKAPASESGVQPVPKPKGRPRKSPATGKAPPAPPRKPTKKAASERDPPKTPTASLKTYSRGKWHDVDEIEDSEPELTPPPRRHRNQPSSQSPPLELVAPAKTASKKATATAALANFPDWAETQTTLYPQISAMVKSAPPTTDPTRPSWWEKMLMYDPIVIEDLTEWLNEGGVRVGRVVREVTGKGKKKEVDMVQAEEEVKAWMVQKWCEDHSVCCLWREGLRGGVRSRY
ncbi:hypothetical protein K402DRAFT_389975 [Aulographum hederae CBS 113979]|uniref:Structure-specific endonuclease subunit SLX4 n=1 Tax=Aulographum hederae CBS 113979 TaxID=1176131 RepID=A0A6G1HAW3_9PEZI|nr:hypothetical protein K402DRAFT_389975 [Aulographum hederae CBS 113979]